MNLIGYLRVSTDQQAESGLGLEAQKHACVEYARKLGIEIKDIFVDTGVSGSLPFDKRPGLLNAINALSKGDILLCAKRDRLGRDVVINYTLEVAVKKRGARIISVAGEGTENDDPSSIVFRQILDVISNYERLLIGLRTKAALQAKRDRCERLGYIPFGYKLANDGKHIEVNQEEKNILNYMLNLKQQSFSIREMVKILNEEQRFNRKDHKWNHSSVHRILIAASKST